MEAIYIPDWKTWKSLAKHYDFDPYKEVDFSIDKGGGNSTDYNYVGEVPGKEELLEWIDDLIVDAGVDKPYRMNEKDRQIYQKILDILEDYFEKELANRDVNCVQHKYCK